MPLGNWGSVVRLPNLAAIMTSSERPPGGYQFEAVQVSPEGWLCLAPWVQSEEGTWWRPHIAGCERYGDDAKRWAERMANAINQAMKDSK